MSNTEYLPAIYRDLGALNFNVATLEPQKVEASDIFNAVSLSRSIGDHPIPRNARVCTEYGNNVYEAMNSGVSFGHHDAARHYYVCREAESALLLSIRGERREDTNTCTPIIIHQEGIPVGIIKGIGEKTSFIMQTIKKKGLLANTFSLPRLQITPTILSKDEPAYMVDVSEFGIFSPLRFAMTAIPLKERLGIHTGSLGESVIIDLDEITHRATQLLKIAKPLAGAALRDARQKTIDYYSHW